MNTTNPFHTVNGAAAPAPASAEPRMFALPPPHRNRLFRALPVEVRERVFPHLELVEMPLGSVLYEAGGIPQHAYFPTDSIISLQRMMEDGESTEIAVVGNKGMVGVCLFLGGETTTNRAVVRSAGYAYRLRGPLLKREFACSAAMQNLLLRYTQALLTQMSQAAVCNRYHSVSQQLCRWLLTSLDRLSSNDLNMTQEQIATCSACAAKVSRPRPGNCGPRV